MADLRPISRVGIMFRLLGILLLVFFVLIQAYAPREIEIPLLAWLGAVSLIAGAEGGQDVAMVIRAWRGGGNGES